ncbi:hypothetical protein AVEN_157482-1 [Araneus ventricosus]|uniref:Uncharacterized protein n=1 Tax=Araneus ventricosus TaxID=182803 RepID=A0A4Y2IAM7_ARAVE|nr:hypothetical protein AVEN_91387-1 [Araneus ventricosus]GBM74071.1 hypothetical protein AVEN_52715-1 [Araneus ventricosus]GBM74106.1 hypothetical protein AVEN_157482-1 [Araneus ventricosus]
MYDLACNRPYTENLRWNRVSGLEHSGPSAEALPLGHRGPQESRVRKRNREIKESHDGDVIRSPDLTPSDFLMWNYVKDCLYQMLSVNLHELKHRITVVIHSIAPQMLVNTWREIEYRLDILCATKGPHIDIY